MRKAAPSILFVGVLLAVGVITEAQQTAKIPRLAILTTGGPARDSARYAGVHQALREKGYIEGQNIAIEHPWWEGIGRDQGAGLAAELARLKIDIIVLAGGDTLIRNAIDATKTIPIVMWGQGSDPVAAGFVQSVARTGGNLTGITNVSLNLSGKRLELFKEAVPKASRVAVLYDPGSPGASRDVKEDLPASARALKLTLQPWEIRNAEEIDKVFTAVSKQRPDGLYVTATGGVTRANIERIIAFALKSRIPATYASRLFVESGGLMSYGAAEAVSYARVAYYVDRILKGAKPAELPVEQPTKFEFVINLNAAKEIGLTIPPSVLARADRVIK